MFVVAVSPQWLLLSTCGGFVGFRARWWWGRRSRAPLLRLCCGELVAAADRELQLGGSDCRRLLDTVQACCEQHLGARAESRRVARAAKKQAELASCKALAMEHRSRRCCPRLVARTQGSQQPRVGRCGETRISSQWHPLSGRPQKARRARAQDADAREALLLIHQHRRTHRRLRVGLPLTKPGLPGLYPETRAREPFIKPERPALRALSKQ